MAVRGFMKSSGIAALAIGLAALALPASASAQEGWRGRGGQQSGEARQSNGGGEQRSAWQGRNGGEGQRGGEGRGGFRGNRDGQQAPRAQAPVQAQPQPQAQARAQWQGNRSGDGARSWRQAAPQQNAQRAPWNAGGGQRGNWNRDNDRRQDAQRNWNRDNDRRVDAQRNWNGNDRSRFDNNRSRFDGNRNWNGSNNRGWNNDWRRDNRYNWQSYRNANRNLFRGDRYYSPYRNWNYRRLSIGFTLQPLFYSSSYWINDPWQYRLPEADGPYRWVRYYDDALLVDIYSGEVVDVINDFFW
jgi:hypothetical protein